MTCSDPESFVRGGPNLIMFFSLIRGQRIPIPPAKRHLNSVSLAGRRWPNIECWLSSFVIFQGNQTSIAKKTYIFVIYQGADPLTSPHTRLDRPMCDDFCDTLLGFTVYIYSTAKETHINQHLFNFENCTTIYI